MTDHDPTELPSLPEEVGGRGRPAKPVRARRDPAATLNLALLVYILVNLFFGLPLLVFPSAFFDFIGVDKLVATQLDGLRWVGAMLMAWAVSGVLVLAKPGGRAIFVTTGSLQMSAAGLVMLYSWSVGEILGSLWYHATATIIVVGVAVFLWWARLAGRSVLSGKPPRSARR